MSRLLFRSMNASKSLGSSTFLTNSRIYCSSSDDEKAPKKWPQANPTKKNEAINKLNVLLQQIVQDDKNQKSTLNLAKPRGRNAKTEPGVKSTKVETMNDKIVTAVKGVAESLGGNKSQTESELLNRLINNDEKPAITSNLSDIVRGMKIDREVKAESRAKQVRNLIENVQQHTPMRQRSARPQRSYAKPIVDAANAETIDIFGAEPLGIFTSEYKGTETKMNATWDKLYERDLKLAVTHPPLNYFQEQILWTEQGKIWKFPINNEQGMEEEQNVYFAEHVFLEEHLSPWCPTKGPLRHFMELVCVGLSKNPYMSVQDKKEHIKWFENYFEEKKKLLQETGALPAGAKTSMQIESKQE